jgi:hypothetical protein
MNPVKRIALEHARNFPVRGRAPHEHSHLTRVAAMRGVRFQRVHGLEYRATRRFRNGLRNDPVVARLFEQLTGTTITIEGTDANHDDNAQPTQHTRSCKAVRQSRVAGGADPARMQGSDHARVATRAARSSRSASRSRS